MTRARSRKQETTASPHSDEGADIPAAIRVTVCGTCARWQPDPAAPETGICQSTSMPGYPPDKARWKEYCNSYEDYRLMGWEKVGERVEVFFRIGVKPMKWFLP